MPKNRIHKRKDGRYTYSVTDAVGKRHNLTSRRGEPKPEFAKRCDALDRLTESEVRAETLDDLFEMFRAQYLAVHNSKSDNEITTYLYKDHVHDLLGHRKINEITRADVNHVLTAALKKGLSPSTIKKIRGCISRPYNWAINSLGIKIMSPTAGLVFRYAKTDTKQPIKVITDDEARRFFEAAKGTKYVNYFRLLYETGIRPSEALGLQIPDVAGPDIQIRRGVTARGLSELKTKRAIRDIPITPEVRAVIDNQIKRVGLSTRERWLFASQSGQPKMSMIVTAFKRIRRKTGRVGRGKGLSVTTPPVAFSLYDFRHTFATRMASKGMNPKTLQYIMGHSDISTTLRYYVGITDEMMEDAKQIMSS
jgi:integrase